MAPSDKEETKLSKEERKLLKEQRKAAKAAKKARKAAKKEAKAAAAENSSAEKPEPLIASESKSNKDQKKKDKKDKKRKIDDAKDIVESKKSKVVESSTAGVLSKEDRDKWLRENEIEIEDTAANQIWNPYLSFAATGLSPAVLHSTRNFDKPTRIQSSCFPIAFANRDLIGIAETGSGKTMAFGLPVMNYLEKNPNLLKAKQPSVLVLAPTRELALQIREQFDLMGEKLGVKSIVLFGGVPKWEQKNALYSGVQVIIACPGRLPDLVDEGVCNLSKVNFIVLDEADRMLDMGFEKEVRRIISMTASQRQTLMFSATWPASIQKLASEFLKKPVKITVGSPDLGASSNVTQIVEVLQNPRDKENRLAQLLQKYHSSRKNRVLIFALYKKEAARIEQGLTRRGWKCIAIHGDMNQNERNRNFYQFKNGEVPLLVATDVAARGLDIPDVEYVINVTFPLTIEDYVHRIGRTGRAGKKGIAHTFFTQEEKAKSGELINLLKQTQQPVPDALLAFGTTVKKKEHSAYGAFFKDIDPNQKATKITFGSDDEE